VDECKQHQACSNKLMQTCLDMAAVKERMGTCEYDCKQLNQSIYGSGGSDSIKSRIKGTEDTLSGLKDLVLENRQINHDTFCEIKKDTKIIADQLKIDTEKTAQALKTDSDDKLRGLFKIFVMTVTASSIIVGAMFSFLWIEGKNDRAEIKASIAAIRQMRQPSPSPQLPFKNPVSVEGER